MRILAKTNAAFTDVVWVFDSSGAGVTGLVDAGFTAKVTLKNGVRVATPTFTLTEIDSTNAPGAYVVAFTPDADAAWQLRFKHATYNVRGWTVNLTSYARGLDDHAWPTTAGRSINVSAAGEADANVAKWLTGTPNALQSGRVDSYLGAVAAGVIAAASFAANALDAVWGTATRALTDKSGFALSSAGVQAIWDALTSALTTVGSVGKRISDNLDVVLSTRLASASYSAPPSAATIAAAVADESLSGHTTAGTLGEAIKTLRAGVLSTGTAQSGTTTTIQLAAGETAQAEAYYGAILTIVSGTGAPQTRSLGYYNSTTKTATVTYPFATAPDNTSVYRIEAGPTEVLGVAIVGPSAISATSLAADTINASKVADGTITASKLASNSITAAKIATDAIGAAQLAADAVAEIAAAISVPTANQNADAYLDRAGAIDGYTPREAGVLSLAALAGRDVGTLANPQYEAVDGSKVRLDATIAAGIRAAVTRDAT